MDQIFDVTTPMIDDKLHSQTQFNWPLKIRGRKVLKLSASKRIGSVNCINDGHELTPSSFSKGPTKIKQFERGKFQHV